MNFAADIGNSFSKLGLFEGEKLKKAVFDLSIDQLANTLNDQGAGRVIISSVSTDPKRLIDRLIPGFDYLVLNHTSKLPVSVKYGTPETLGVDRIAGVCGAFFLAGGNNCLVIDIGTCITYDYLDAGGSYWGGAISPGLRIRAKSLNHYTANLPMIEFDSNPDLIGSSTAESISSGVVNGTAAEIESMIHKFKQEVGPGLKVYLCGGDAALFESTIKAPIFVVPELVLLGLNQILLRNE